MLRFLRFGDSSCIQHTILEISLLSSISYYLRENLAVGHVHIILKFRLRHCPLNLLEVVHAKDCFQLLVVLTWLFGA